MRPTRISICCAATHPEYVLILAGDHAYKMDYARMLVDHAARDADMTIACIEVPLADATALGVMEVDATDGSRASRKSRRNRSRSPDAPTSRSAAWASTCSTRRSSTSS